jgi:hypothetical protein
MSLSPQLVAAGEHLRGVCPTLSARVRFSGSTKAGNDDDNGALSLRIVGLRQLRAPSCSQQ